MNHLSIAKRIWLSAGVSAAGTIGVGSGWLLTAGGSIFWCWALIIISLVASFAVAACVAQSIGKGLKRLVEELDESIGQVSSAAIQISSSSQSLAQGTSEQAASLEETSASSEEMTSMTRKNADNSLQCTQLMSVVDSRVAEANRTLQQMVASMAEINGSSEKISKIIKVIDEIAFQTNILALNAAVEAARAGQAGMGFAVVADEVRSLAERSAQAAKDTAVLIEDSIATTNEGGARLTEVTSVIKSITESANHVKTLVDEVNLGSQEQARGIEQISKAITQIEQVTQRAAASAEETASAGEELSAQSQAMHAALRRLQEISGITASGISQRPRSQARPAQQRPQSGRTSLAALSKAVSKSSAVRHAPVEAGPVSINRSAIPLDDDFKEF
ncbi:MAG TPA: methyl-accepting chemotaxis protein [Bryobacteraceae bacterium]|jgi:methyl-accepting chemotaxis protein/methyl-accepting chemotaxis protein-1 (serine sensor receptor)|nr:methyl-accepting chemotaxis protein [Bryobacteraceae bacterium]